MLPATLFRVRCRGVKLNLVEWSVTDQRLVAAFEYVAQKIPPGELESFPDLEVLQVAQTTWGANVRPIAPGVMQIQLAPTQLFEMMNGSEPALRALIAHELAHAFFRHSETSDGQRDGLAEEDEADAKAREWVGEAAVAEFRASVGPPSIDRWKRRESS